MTSLSTSTPCRRGLAAGCSRPVAASPSKNAAAIAERTRRKIVSR
jgi:hypothetical protein